MALPIEKLEETLVAAVRQIGNAHSTLLNEDNTTISVREINVEVNLIAVKGMGAVQIESLSVTPERTSKTKQKSQQTQGIGISETQDDSTSDSSKTSNEDSEDTQEYGRQTLGETTFKD